MSNACYKKYRICQDMYKVWELVPNPLIKYSIKYIQTKPTTATFFSGEAWIITLHVNINKHTVPDKRKLNIKKV